MNTDHHGKGRSLRALAANDNRRMTDVLASVRRLDQIASDGQRFGGRPHTLQHSDVITESLHLSPIELCANKGDGNAA